MNLKIPKKHKGLAKTIIDPLGLGVGDAVFGKNKGPDYSAEEAAKQAAFDKGQAATDEFVAGGPAKYDKGADLTYASLSPAEKLQWQSLSPAEKQAQSGMADIKTDAKYKEHEMAALRELEDQSQNGFTARDKADMARVESSVNRANKGRLGAIQQNMQARGMSGSGMDLVAQMQSSQDANEIAAMKALEQEGMMQDRKSSATMNLGQMSSQLQSRDFGQEATKAQAQDAINRFNTQNSNDNARYNNQGQNSTAQNNWQQTNSDNRYNNQNVNQTNEANWNRGNATSDRNTGAQYQYNQDRLNAKLGQTTGAFNYAQDSQNMKMQRDKEAADAAGGKMGAILGTAGAVVGGIYGGPAGAAAGSQLGSGVGNQVGRTQYANSYAAHGGYVGDFDNMEGYDDSFDLDTEPTMLSPGEIVIPRSHAKSPASAAKFVSKLQANPESDSISERNNPNFGRSPDFTNMDPKVLNHLAKTNPSLVDAYRKKMEAADGNVNSAKDMAKLGGYADVAGGLLTDFNNSQRKDVILGNRLQDMGKKHDRIEADRTSWKSVAPMFEKGVSEAKEERGIAEDRFNKETQLGVMDRASAKEAKSNDPSSAESVAAREFLKQVAPDSIKMAGFDNLTEAQAYKVAGPLFDKYKTDKVAKNDPKTRWLKDEKTGQWLLVDGNGNQMTSMGGGRMPAAGGRMPAPGGRMLDGESDESVPPKPIPNETAAAYKARMSVWKAKQIEIGKEGVKKEGELNDAEAASSQKAALAGRLQHLYNSAKGDTGPVMGRISKVQNQFGFSAGADADQLMNQTESELVKYIKDTSGATVPETERAALRALMPKITDSPELYKHNLAAMMDKADQIANDARAKAGKAPKTSTQKTQKTVASKQYSQSRNQTKITYSDGSVEVKDGK